ncbi:MAG: glycosyltransferase [bacterium]
MNNNAPDVTIIIPVYRGNGIIERCLNAISLQETEYSMELIVVDDGSDDRTVQIVEEWIQRHTGTSEASWDARLIKQPHRGPAAARNLGAREARGAILLFTDADCEPCPDWVDNMMLPFQNSEICGAKGVYETRQTNWVARLVQVEYQEKYDRMQRFDSIDFIDTYAAAFRRDVFLSLGGFDESFPTASVEDQEFSFRMAERGYRMTFVPDARVVHHHAATLWRYAVKKFRIAYYKSYLLIRHPDRVKGDTHTPPSLVLQIPLTYALLALVVVAPFRLSASLLIVPIAAAVLFCMIGTIRVCRRQAPTLIPRLPLVLVVRSLALGAGLVLGSIRFRLMGKAKSGEQLDKS